MTDFTDMATSANLKVMFKADKEFNKTPSGDNFDGLVGSNNW